MLPKCRQRRLPAPVVDANGVINAMMVLTPGLVYWAPEAAYSLQGSHQTLQPTPAALRPRGEAKMILLQVLPDQAIMIGLG
jgi:hypothetical protein